MLMSRSRVHQPTNRDLHQPREAPGTSSLAAEGDPEEAPSWARFGQLLFQVIGP